MHLGSRGAHPLQLQALCTVHTRPASCHGDSVTSCGGPRHLARPVCEDGHLPGAGGLGNGRWCDGRDDGAWGSKVEGEGVVSQAIHR